MRTLSFASLALAAIGVAHAQTIHTVIVGGPGGVVKYTPDHVDAAVGDTITFVFQQKNHTVTQSSLQNPCTPLPHGFDSGFHFVDASNVNGPFDTANLTIGNTDPVWVHCRQTLHCAMGMVFAVNPGDNFAQFVAAAEATGNNTGSTGGSGGSGTTPPPPTTPTNHKVIVGNNGTLRYDPQNITAAIGDTITFQFMAKNHTATRSSFADPCRMIGATSGTPGFDSGFMPVSANATDFPTYTVTVNDTDPTWVYCRQDNPMSHCGQGMVFAVNANESSQNSFEAFQALAMKLNGTGTSGAPPAATTTTTTTTKSAASSLYIVPGAFLNAMVVLLLALSL